MKEYRSISIDATYKLALKVDGVKRTDSQNYVSIVGLHGAPLALVPKRGEATVTLMSAVESAVPAGARSQVEHVASDVSSPALFKDLHDLLPGLLYLSLDPLHICFTVDSHTKHQRVRPTVIGLVMRAIMGKFSIAGRMPDGEPYRGGPLTQTRAEKLMAARVEKGNMPIAKAITY